ncbi:MAG: Hsp20/alpha crystallin family protein [Haloplanus sp.]
MGRKPLMELETLLDELSERFEHERMGLGGEIATAAVDIAEWDGEYLVIADIPGFEPEDIDLRVNEDTLYLSAEHKGEHEPEVETYLKRERARTSVSRTVDLPEPVDEERVSATYDNGVLTVTLPKAFEEESDEGHRVEIT